MNDQAADPAAVGSVVPGLELELEVGEVAHGGHCVARHDGRVVFVRHALPGERVVARVTGSGKGGRFLRADAVRVLRASADRVPAPCPHAGPGRCGGCDWQHASLPAQRQLKTRVLHEALRHQGGLVEIAGRPVEEAVTVVAVPGDQDGLRWRTRVVYHADRTELTGSSYPDDEDGDHAYRIGLLRHRSAQVEAVDDCRIATESLSEIGVTTWDWGDALEIRAVASSTGDRLVMLGPPPDRREIRDLAKYLPADLALPPLRGRAWVTERAAGRLWRVDGDGFWQVHPGAADTLVDAVRDLLRPSPGEHLLDLYSGVGLFAGALAGDLGPDGRVDAVEASLRAVQDARRNLHDLPQVRLHHAQVGAWLAARAVRRADLVVLDPPRTGAGAEIVAAVLEREPRAVAYVACDPVTLARDLGTARERGWTVGEVRGFDLFPMTHHLEAVALLVPPEARQVS